MCLILFWQNWSCTWKLFSIIKLESVNVWIITRNSSTVFLYCFSITQLSWSSNNTKTKWTSVVHDACQFSPCSLSCSWPPSRGYRYGSSWGCCRLHSSAAAALYRPDLCHTHCAGLCSHCMTGCWHHSHAVTKKQNGGDRCDSQRKSE